MEFKAQITVFLENQPGVMADVCKVVSERGINIEDVRNPHDPKTNRSLAIMKVNQRVPDDLIECISDEIKAISAFSIKL